MVAAIVVVVLLVAALAILLVGVLVWMQQSRRKLELTTGGSNYSNIEGTYHAEQGSRSTFPMKPGGNLYAPVPGTVKNVAAMREDEGDAPEKDVFRESSKDAHL